MQWRRQALYTDGRRAEVGLVEFKACCASSENNASGRQPTLPQPALPQPLPCIVPQQLGLPLSYLSKN